MPELARIFCPILDKLLIWMTPADKSEQASVILLCSKLAHNDKKLTVSMMFKEIRAFTRAYYNASSRNFESFEKDCVDVLRLLAIKFKDVGLFVTMFTMDSKRDLDLSTKEFFGILKQIIENNPSEISVHDPVRTLQFL